MIYVDRGSEPDGFSKRASDWRERFEKASEQNPGLSISKFWSKVRSEIRADAQELYEVFHGKCAYCEAKMAHVSSPRVEHYYPKSKFPDRVFDWQNWLLSCGRCNDKKWAHFPECNGQPCLLNPTIDDPAAHLDFLREQVLPQTRRGEETIKMIGLNRSPLEDDRALWLMRIDELLLLACSVSEVSAEARELLIWAMQADAPYSAMTRSYLREITPKLAKPDKPHPPIILDDPQERVADLVKQNTDQLRQLV